MRGVWPKQRSVLVSLWIAALSLIVIARFVDIRTYPLLGPDEGLWNIEIKDAVLFGDRTKSGLPQVFASPVHYVLGRLWLSILPATCFSLRWVSGAWGVVTLALMFSLLNRRYGCRTALACCSLAACSFTMFLINRRAYLESAVMAFSLLAVVCAVSRSRFRYLGLFGAVWLLLAHKATGISVVPALMLPMGEWRRDLPRRMAAVVLGVAMAALTIWSVSQMAPGESGPMWAVEFSKGAGEASLIRVGRFGLYPDVLRHSAEALFLGLTDLALFSLLAVVAFVMARAWRDPFALRIAVWLVVGYGWILVQAWQHAQYFAPLVVPSVLLLVVSCRMLERPSLVRGFQSAAVLVILLSFARVGYGWQKAHKFNPPLSAIEWLETQDLEGGTFLAGPDVAAATELRGYPFSRIFHPMVGEPPTLLDFVREKHVRFVIFDQWESAPFFLDDDQFHAELAVYERVASGSGWVAYRTAVGNASDGKVPLGSGSTNRL